MYYGRCQVFEKRACRCLFAHLAREKAQRAHTHTPFLCSLYFSRFIKSGGEGLFASCVLILQLCYRSVIGCGWDHNVRFARIAKTYHSHRKPSARQSFVWKRRGSESSFPSLGYIFFFSFFVTPIRCRCIGILSTLPADDHSNSDMQFCS